MKRLRVRMVQQLSPIPATIVPLPSYSIVAADYANMRAIVDVPDADFPSTSLNPGENGYAEIDGVPVLTRQSALERNAWHARLASRWRRNATSFICEVV